VGNWRQSPEARKVEKLSDDAATDGDPGATILRNNAALADNVEDDGQPKTAGGNWRQSTFRGDLAWLENVEDERQRQTVASNWRQ